MKKIFFNKIPLLIIIIVFNFSYAQKDEKEQKIDEVVLKKGKPDFKNKKENPAYAIMREVWKHKHNNGLRRFKTYKFKEYEKIEFDVANIDSSFMDKKVFKKLDFIFDYADSADNGRLMLPVFLNEAIYHNFGQNEPIKKNKRLMVAEKTSGFQDNQIVSLTAKNLYKEIDIYDNIINYFDIGFQSPVSKEGFSTYNYELMDTITLSGQRSFKIRYEPKRKDVLAFQGYLYISTETYSVVQATLRSTKKMNVNFVNGIFTELEFDNPDEETFLPKKIRTAIDLSPFSKNKKAKSLVAIRTIDFSDYEFNPSLTEKDFEARESELTSDYVQKDDTFWEIARTDSLSKTEKGIYEMLDRLNETPRFQKIIKTYETFASGYYNVGNVFDIGSVYSIYGRNEVEGNRLRLGGRTYFSQNDDWRIQSYGAYGFKDHQFKYGAEAKYMFNKINRFTIGAGTRRDILQLGVQLTTDDGIMSRSFASSAVFGRGENTSLSSVNQTNFFASIDPWKNLTVRLDGLVQSIKSADEEKFNLHYYDNDGMLRKTVNDSHLTLSLIARPGAKFSQTGVDRYEHSTLAPTIVLKYTRGLENLFNADYGYNKLQFMFYKPMLIGSWGKSFFSFETGKNFEPLPLTLQNVIPGNQSYSLVPNTFAQLNYYEFVTDQYATAHLEHHFNGKILSYIPLIKKLKLREVAFGRAAFGTLSEESKAINVNGFKYSAPNKNIYYEFGFGIENIGFGNLRLFRIDFNWRGNYLDKPNVSKFGIKAGIQFFY